MAQYISGPAVITGQIRFSGDVPLEQVKFVAETLLERGGEKTITAVKGFKFLTVRSCGQDKQHRPCYGIAVVFEFPGGSRQYHKVVDPIIVELRQRFADNVSWDLTNENYVLVDKL